MNQSNQKSDAERTAREEGWRLCDDVDAGDFDGAPAGVVASAIRHAEPPFFNIESKEFSSAAGWEELLVEQGIALFDRDWRIPEGLCEKGSRVARDIRNMIASRSGEPPDAGGCTVFRSPQQQSAIETGYIPKKAVLAIIFDGGDMARYLNLAYENYEAFDRIMNLIYAHGMWFENITHWWGWVYED